MSYKRPRRHDQRSIPTGTVCKNCQDGICNQCVDIPRIALGLADKSGLLCQCRKAGHDGEPMRNQILDPDTQTVHAPGVDVLQDGTVISTDAQKR